MCAQALSWPWQRRGERCFVIAELGVNHNGALADALRLLDAAKAAGADAAKIQLFQPAELCSAQRAAERDMLEGLMLDISDVRAICERAAAIELPLFATPFDTPSLKLLLRLPIPVIKIGSGEVTHTPFLREIAGANRPVILSTGGCELSDVDRAVDVLRDAGCEHLALLHCVSAYPPPDHELNLWVTPFLAARYRDCAVGFSDHSLGSEAAIAAVALGARLIEKHLTLDTRAAGPDHAASADPDAFAALVRSVRRVERMLGDGQKRLMPCEGLIGRSIVTARPLPAGHCLSADDLAFKRPAGGLRPYAASEIIGRTLQHALPADDLIRLADLAPAQTHFVASAACDPSETQCAQPLATPTKP